EQERTTPRIDGERGLEEPIVNEHHLARRNIISGSTGYNVAWWIDLPKPPPAWAMKLDGNIVWARAGRPNYLYGARWQDWSKEAGTPADFKRISSVTDTSLQLEPRFVNPAEEDYRLADDSPRATQNAGAGAR